MAAHCQTLFPTPATPRPSRRRSLELTKDNRDFLLGLHRQMQLIRRFEETHAGAVHEGEDRRLLPPQHRRGGHGRRRHRGPASRTDYIFTSYREHGHAIARGIDPKAGHGRAVRQGDRHVARSRRLDAPVRLRTCASWAATAIVGGHLPARDRRRAGRSLPASRRTSSSACSATARPTSARSTSR